MNNTAFRQKVREQLNGRFKYVNNNLKELNILISNIIQLDMPKDSWMSNHFTKGHLHEVLLEIYQWVECDRPIPSTQQRDEFYNAVLAYSILGRMVRVGDDYHLEWTKGEKVDVIIYDNLVSLSATSHRLIFLEELCTWIHSVTTAQPA